MSEEFRGPGGDPPVRNVVRKAGTIRSRFPVVDRRTVSGLVVGEICFTCLCRVVQFAGEDGMTLAWCQCEWADDAALMEVIG